MPDRSLLELAAERSTLARLPDDQDQEAPALASEVMLLEGLRQRLTQVDQAGVGDTDRGGQVEMQACP